MFNLFKKQKNPFVCEGQKFDGEVLAPEKKTSSSLYGPSDNIILPPSFSVSGVACNYYPCTGQLLTTGS